MRFQRVNPLFLILVLSVGCSDSEETSGNPLFKGWYADPEGAVFGSEYWIYPTTSAPYDEQVFFDAFSSKDLIVWEKHARVLDTSDVTWAHRALWAPSVIEKQGRYFLFFSANDVQRPGGPLWNENDPRNHYGGIGIAIADSPAGPFRDYLGEPLVSDFYNDAQPIDQFVFEDLDGTCYLIYGGWNHCNIGILKSDFTGFVPWEDGSLFKEITPQGYVEGPVMFLRNEKYYFMWSEGNWGDGSYKVAYATAERPTGPFDRVGTVLESDDDVATGGGHNSVIRIPGTDDWCIVYHRRPIPNQGRDHRVTCIDRLEFNENGTIKPVTMTFAGVEKRVIQDLKVHQ